MALAEDITNPATSVATLAEVGNNAHYGDSVIRHGNLAYQAGNYLDCPTTSGDNFAFTPHTTEMEITGDMDWRALVDTDLFGATTTIASLSDFVAGATYLAWNYNRIVLSYYDSGGTRRDVQEANTLAVDGPTWLRATRNAATGEVNFYRSTDGENWGTPTYTEFTNPGPMQAPLAEFAVGSSRSGISPNFQGRIYRAQLFGSIDGSNKIVDVDFSTFARNTLVGNALTGQKFTVVQEDIGGVFARITAEQLVSDATQDTLNSAPIYLPKEESGSYLHLPGLSGNTVTLPLTDGVYSAVITYADLTTANDSFTATGGVMTIGPTGANIANKQILRIELTGAEPANLNFLDQAHGTASFTCSTDQTVTVNRSGSNPATIIANSVIRYDGLGAFMQAVGTTQLGPGHIAIFVGAINDVINGRVQFSMMNVNAVNDGSGQVITPSRQTSTQLASRRLGVNYAEVGTIAEGDRFTHTVITESGKVIGYYNDEANEDTLDLSSLSTDQYIFGATRSALTTYSNFASIDVEATYIYEDPVDPATRAELLAGIESLHNTYPES